MAASPDKDNPYRFKGYYYDEETGMYYLKSRYYQPEICRFISADNEDVLIDTHVDLANKNLYLYCDNNPILKADEEGQIADWLVSACKSIEHCSLTTVRVSGKSYCYRHFSHRP